MSTTDGQRSTFEYLLNSDCKDTQKKQTAKLKVHPTPKFPRPSPSAIHSPFDPFPTPSAPHPLRSLYYRCTIVVLSLYYRSYVFNSTTIVQQPPEPHRMGCGWGIRPVYRPKKTTQYFDEHAFFLLFQNKTHTFAFGKAPLGIHISTHLQQDKKQTTSLFLHRKTLSTTKHHENNSIILFSRVFMPWHTSPST